MYFFLNCRLGEKGKVLICIFRVSVNVIGCEIEEFEVVSRFLYKKNFEVGEKKLVFVSKLIMEQEDVKIFGENEEVCVFLCFFMFKLYSL